VSYGTSAKCRRHGPRCSTALCEKAPVKQTEKCRRHTVCSSTLCHRKPHKNGLCRNHTPRCDVEKCWSKALGPEHVRCIAHGGGLRCNYENCTGLSVVGMDCKCKNHLGEQPVCNREDCYRQPHAKGLCKSHVIRCGVADCKKAVTVIGGVCKKCALE